MATTQFSFTAVSFKLLALLILATASVGALSDSTVTDNAPTNSSIIAEAVYPMYFDETLKEAEKEETTEKELEEDETVDPLYGHEVEGSDKVDETAMELKLVAKELEAIRQVFLSKFKIADVADFGDLTLATPDVSTRINPDSDKQEVEKPNSSSFLRGRVSTFSSSSPCETQKSCGACANLPECQWCGGNLKVSIPFEKDFTMSALGVCLDKTVSCADDVKFGEVAGLFDVSVLGVHPTEWSVVSVSAKDPACASVAWPKETAAPSCDECVKLGDGVGWCAAEISAMLGIHSEGGFCIRESFAFLCDPTLFPQVPGISVDIKMAYVTTASQCKTKTPSVVPPPSPKCGNNLSCDSCTSSSSECTWCGMHGTMEMAGMKANAGLSGRCVDGSNADCSKVKPGELMNLVTPFIPEVTIDAIPNGSNICTSTQWPTISWDAKTCEDCGKHPNAGWCWGGYGGKLGGGCLPGDWEWMCNADIFLEADMEDIGEVTMKWVAGGDKTACSPPNA